MTKSWVSGAICGAVIAAVCLGCGVLVGAKKPVVIEATARFIPQTEGKAFDTKTGRTCLIVVLPSGATLEGPEPACSELAKR